MKFKRLEPEEDLVLHKDSSSTTVFWITRCGGVAIKTTHRSGIVERNSVGADEFDIIARQMGYQRSRRKATVPVHPNQSQKKWRNQYG